MGATHIRLGGHRIDVRVGSHFRDFADLLMGVTRSNYRVLRDDRAIRDEVLRRVQTPPCPVRCWVSPDGLRHNCTCESGYQYTSDAEAEALEQCPARDVWKDVRAQLIAHTAQGLGAHDPILVDCDCITPTTISAAAYLAWEIPRQYALNGVNLGAHRSDVRRFGLAITLPPPPEDPRKERVGHVYGLVNYLPPAPQPAIRMPFEGGPWYVWDGSCHFGMDRPPAHFYTTGEIAGYELKRDDLDGLRIIR